MFKDENDSGRTIIHHHACPNVGDAFGIVLKLSKVLKK